MPSNHNENFPLFPLLNCQCDESLVQPPKKKPVLPKIKSTRRMFPPLKLEKKDGIKAAPSETRSKSSALQDIVPKESAEPYTPVSFTIVTPDKLPYMGNDYRQVGRVKRITTETSAMKKNEVHQCKLDKIKYSLAKGKQNTEKDYIRTLLLWHMESERNTNNRDLALERRTSRILKFMDNMSSSTGDFHFTESFFNDLADPQYDPEPSPPPVRPNTKRPLISRKGKPTTNYSFKRVDPKEEALRAKFADCIRAGEVSGAGYTYVKLYTDPYYRYLPPLSAASKKFDMKVARLPHKKLRDEEQWNRFLETLKPRPKTPVKRTPTKPDFSEINRQRADELKKRLPIISLLPKWLQEIRGTNDYRTDRYKNRTDKNTDIYEQVHDYLNHGPGGDNSNSKTKRGEVKKESRENDDIDKPVSVRDVSISPVIKVQHRVALTTPR